MNIWIRSTRLLVCVLACCGPLVLPAAAHAGATESQRLSARLDPAAAATVASIVDDARRKSLPTEPLISTALEGAARGASADRIVAAVRAQALALEVARGALDGRSTEAEIVAGASAIRAGVPADSLARLRAARPGSMVVPLVVIADMVARGVPPTTASTEVIAATRVGTRDADLLRLREHVARDIQAGTLPGDAARIQTQALMTEISGRPRGTSPSPRSHLPGTTP